MTRRPLSGVLFLALAGVLAWGGTVDPGKTAVRWIVAAALAGWGLVSLFSERVPWLRERDRIDQVYAQMIAMGLAIGAVGWLIPGSGSRGLIGIAGLMVFLPLGLWIWVWYQRRQGKRDDTDRSR
jgi:hypothetical protein